MAAATWAAAEQGADGGGGAVSVGMPPARTVALLDPPAWPVPSCYAVTTPVVPPQGNKEALLAAGAVPLLLRCLQGAGAAGGAGGAAAPSPCSALSGGPVKYAAHALCNLCLMEVRGCGAAPVPPE